MKKLQQEIDEYLIERDWKIKSGPDLLAKSIVVEAAELLELFQYTNLSQEELLKNQELVQKVKDELGDVMIYAAEMANILNTDLVEITRAKLEKAKKKYPVELVKGNSDNYYEIKKQHRNNA